jgi:hypothetical protein
MPDFNVPTSNGALSITAAAGKSVVLLGANGSGKTRLGVKIEMDLGAQHQVHRIGAHRSLVLNTNIQPPSYQLAERRLLYGYDKGEHGHREGHRWQSKPATHLISDFDHVVAALYADENQISVLHRQAHLKDSAAKPPATKLDSLKEIWHALLPHRQLVTKDGTIEVKPPEVQGRNYDAGELSDGERVIFYLIGQALLAKTDTLLIVDEPELHINRAILAKLWDAIESKRKDCAFIYLTHDIEFTISRRSASKYTVKSYVRDPNPEWEIEAIPDDTGIPEEILTMIAGSRLPILFVEGDGGSLDAALYRRVYDQWTVVPVGTCDGVIHSVSSFQKHSVFHRLGCVGIIDADGRSNDETAKLAAGNVKALAVSEVENVLLLPKPFVEMAKLLHFDQKGAEGKLSELIALVFKEATSDSNRWSIDATRRIIDRTMKTVGLEAKEIGDLQKEFEEKMRAIDAGVTYRKLLDEFNAAITSQDYPRILRLYDNKGLLAHAARILGQKSRKDLEEFVGRVLQNEIGKDFLRALRDDLPKL